MINMMYTSTIQSTLVSTRSAGLTQLSHIIISWNLVIIGQYFYTKPYKTHARVLYIMQYMWREMYAKLIDSNVHCKDWHFIEDV